MPVHGESVETLKDERLTQRPKRATHRKQRRIDTKGTLTHVAKLTRLSVHVLE